MRSTLSPHARGAKHPRSATLALRGLPRAAAIGIAMCAVLGLSRVSAADGPRAGPLFGEGPPPGGARPAPPSPAYLTSSRIAAVDEGALVIDEDSGVLARVDATGASVAQLSIARDAGLLAYDGVARVAYVADRRGDRIVAVQVGTTLEVLSTWHTAAEPYGVALTPDRRTALVTHVADRALVGYDVATGRERWRAALAAEPRGVAVSPDGRRALVAHITMGVLAEVALDSRSVLQLALPTRFRGQHARSAFAVTFVGDDLAAVPFQRETPVANPSEDADSGTYGGAARSPISHHLALFGFAGRRRATAAELEGQPAIDTPSLRGLAASAPYFHDGSAATLEVVLRDRGAVHGMSEPARRLSDGDAADLIAFLETL